MSHNSAGTVYVLLFSSPYLKAGSFHWAITADVSDPEVLLGPIHTFELTMGEFMTRSSADGPISPRLSNIYNTNEDPNEDHDVTFLETASRLLLNSPPASASPSNTASNRQASLSLLGCIVIPAYVTPSSLLEFIRGGTEVLPDPPNSAEWVLEVLGAMQEYTYIGSGPSKKYKGIEALRRRIGALGRLLEAGLGGVGGEVRERAKGEGQGQAIRILDLFSTS